MSALGLSAINNELENSSFATVNTFARDSGDCRADKAICHQAREPEFALWVERELLKVVDFYAYCGITHKMNAPPP